MTISQKQRMEKMIEGLLIENEIALYRFNAHLRRQFVRQLIELERGVVAKISKKGVDSLNSRDLATLLKALDKLIDSTYAKAGNQVISETAQLQLLEIKALTDIYNESYGKKVLNEPKLAQDSNALLFVAGVAVADWFVKQSRDLKFKLGGAIRQANFDGKPTPDIVYDINAHFKNAKHSAETLIKTAVSQARSNAHTAIKKENQSALVGELHISVLDTKTSVICGARSGLVWDLDKNPVEHQVSYAIPPLHPNCRSYLKLLTKSWRELGLDEDEIDEEQDNLTYEEWLKGKSRVEQDQVLGKGKADLWRNGVITFSDMLDQSGRPLTLSDLRAKYKLSNVEDSVKAARLRAIQLEPRITFDMLNLSSRSGGYLEGLDYRLKSIDSLTRKVQSDIIKSGISEVESLNKITDIIRYTTIFDKHNFVENYFKMRESLIKNGYNIVKVKNTWRKGAVYKGINTVIEKDGFLFEMQYHTSQSFLLKNGRLHELYEKIRLLNVSDSEVKLLSQEMERLSDELDTPDNIGKIRL